MTTVASSHILSWSASLSLGAGYDGSVEVVDVEGSYTLDNLLMQVLSLKLTCAGTSSNFSGDTSLLFGDKYWINGAIIGVVPTEEITSRRVRLLIGSYFYQWAKKPINTEEYSAQSADTILDDLFTNYLNIDSSLLSGSVGDSYAYGVITGPSVVDELKKIAQAGQGVLFFSPDGTIARDTIKNHSSSVDHTLPEESIISISRGSSTSNQIPSRIRLRGRYYGIINAGDQNLAGNFQPQNAASSAFPQAEGVTQSCTNPGVTQEYVTVKVGQLKGGIKDVKNAQVDLDDGISVEAFRETGLGAVAIQLKKDDGSFFDGSENTSLNITAPRIDRNDQDSQANFFRPQKKHAKRGDLTLSMLPFILGKLPKRASLGPLYGPSVVEGMSTNSSDRVMDEYEEVRIETIVEDTDFADKFGISYEEIDNQYVNSKETLFDLGIARFQQIRSSQNVYTVACAYMPGLNLNDVVTFTTPKKKDVLQKTITGVITDISVDYEATPSVGMKLTVESFEDNGGQTYASDNLLLDPSMLGVTSGGPWESTSSAWPTGFTWVGGFGYLSATAGYTKAAIRAYHTEARAGETYTISAAHTSYGGTGTLDFYIYYQPGDTLIWSTSFSSSGTLSKTFTSPSDNIQFEWNIVTPPDNTSWSFYAPFLSRTKTV